MSDEIVDRRLRAVLATAHLPIDDRCAALLDALIARAIACLRDERHRIDDADDDALDDAMREAAMTGLLDRAEANLRRLLDDMTQQSRILRFDGLHEPNVVSAMRRLCPLWPFC